MARRKRRIPAELPVSDLGVPIDPRAPVLDPLERSAQGLPPGGPLRPVDQEPAGPPAAAGPGDVRQSPEYLAAYARNRAKLARSMGLPAETSTEDLQTYRDTHGRVMAEGKRRGALDQQRVNNELILDTATGGDVNRAVRDRGAVGVVRDSVDKAVDFGRGLLFGEDAAQRGTSPAAPRSQGGQGAPAALDAPGVDPAAPVAPNLADNSLFAPDAVLGVGGSFQNDARQQRLAELGGGSARAFENPLDPSNLPTGGGGGRGQIAEKAGGLGKELDRFGSPYGPPTQGLDAALWNQGQGGAVPQGGQYAKGGVTPQEGGVPFAEIDKTQAGALNERALSQTPSGVAARHARSGDGGPIDRMVRYRLADGRMVTAVASNAARYTRDGQGAPGAGQGQGQARSGATGAPAASAGAAGADKQKGGLPAWDAYRESQIAMSEAAGGMKGTRPQLSRSEEQALRLQSPAVGIRKAAERKLEAQRRFDDRATSRAERLYVERQGRYERMADRELLRNEAAEERALKRYGIDQAGAAEIRKGRLADEAASRAGDPVARKRMERVDGLYDSWFNGNTYGEPLSTEARAKRQSRFGALTEAQNRYLKSAMADYIYLQGDNEAMLETLDDHLMGLIEEIEARG